MRQAFHPDYEILADLLEEDDLDPRRRIKDKYRLGATSGVRALPKPRKNYEDYLWYFVAFYLFSVIGLYFLLNTSTDSITSLTPSPIKTIEDKITPEGKDLEHEIDLLKQVLTNLTLTVEGLSKQKEGNEPQEIMPEEFKPSVIKITSPKANLREAPSKDSPTVASVKKDTVLMGVGYQDGWILTYAPSGKEAWVHSNLIAKVENPE